jgi:peptidoglycan/LPS O-acetylase OafA/YrhL
MNHKILAIRSVIKKYCFFEGLTKMIKDIQSLRAIAAISVMLLHCGHKITEISSYPYTNPFSLGHSGVDLFFIISGFVMLHTIESNHCMGTFSFLIRRFIRIVPLYWFTTSIFSVYYYSALTFFKPVSLTCGIVFILIFSSRNHNFLLWVSDGRLTI